MGRVNVCLIDVGFAHLKSVSVNLLDTGVNPFGHSYFTSVYDMFCWNLSLSSRLKKPWMVVLTVPTATPPSGA